MGDQIDSLIQKEFPMVFGLISPVTENGTHDERFSSGPSTTTLAAVPRTQM